MPDQEGAPTYIGDVLVQQHFLSDQDLALAQQVAKTKGITLTEALLSEGLITKQLLGQAIAEHLGVPFADMEARPATAEMVMRIPEDVARQFRVVLFGETDKQVTIATDSGAGQQGLDEAMHTLFGDKAVVYHYALPLDIDAAFGHYRKPLASRLSTISTSELAAPALVQEIIADALAVNASDIHIEPQTDDLRVRFRVDGVLHEAAKLERKQFPNILNRIKVLSHMRIDDHFSAQDGAIRFAGVGSGTDVRVSVVPTLEGEKIVMRLLTGAMRGFTLLDLGMSDAHRTILDTAIHKPFGMILVTGPTGSGKTTTLYGVLKTLDQVALNVTTIEDPVEYRLTGINQIQVSEATGLTFALGLRAIVRQNPDVILVGEIRDKETAEIAVNSALTGHLMLSTFHANDSATAVPRLLEVGIEPFLLSSTLELVIAQRLVRRICESCRFAVKHTPEMIRKISPAVVPYFKNGVQLYQGKGCTRCNGIGYRGRVGVFEMISVSRAMRELILKNPSSQEVWSLAKKEGVSSLFEDGLEKVKSGMTTLQELLRVANPPA